MPSIPPFTRSLLALAHDDAGSGAAQPLVRRHLLARNLPLPLRGVRVRDEWEIGALVRDRERGKIAKGQPAAVAVQAAFRSRLHRPPLVHTGITIAGESIVPDLTGENNDAPSASGGIVHLERAASPGDRPDAGTMQAWLFRPVEPPAAVSLDDLPALIQSDDNFVWVDLAGYREEDLHALARALDLHRGAVRAALASWHRPRLSVYPEHFFVSATVATLEPDNQRIEARELDLFAGNNFLVTAHKQPLPFGDHLRARAQSSTELVSLDAAFMLYLVLDETLAYYEELNRHLQAEIEQLEERVLNDTSDAFLGQILSFKRYAFALAQLAEQHRDVFSAFLRPDFPWVAGEVEEYFRDLESRLARVLDILARAREGVNGAFDIYVSHMTHRTNQVIKVLTMVSTIIFPATLIVALFGTSVATSIRRFPVASPAGFVVMLLCIALVTATILWAFHKQDWL